jgi:caffeoyl-CoA O-methyltransferase
MMSDIVPAELERYALEHTTREGPLLARLAAETRARMPGWAMQIGPVEGTFLRLLVRSIGARRIVEIGMFTGYSALMMAEALPDDGRLVTCDVDPEAEAIARRYFAESPHGHKIEVRMGLALQTLRALGGPVDLMFIDADKESYGAYYEEAIRLLRPGGLVVADNALWSGRVLHPADGDDRAIAAFNARVAADPRVEHVLLTVRDGIMLARKKELAGGVRA